jgi:peptidoglycan/xylan/chitin deacetylase (PgdA/CDA1 family)
MRNFSNVLGLVRAAKVQVRYKRRHPKVPILLYHRFHPTQPRGVSTVTTAAFEEQIQWLSDNHYRVVPLRPVVEALRGDGPPIAQPSVAITVDDGDRSVYTEMFPVVQRYRVPVTLFVYPYAISHMTGALTWEELEIMVQSGLVDVQFHTMSHPHFRRERKRRTAADYAAFVDYELRHSRENIEKRLGLTVDMLAWPYGIYDTKLEAAAAQAGYVAAFAVKNRPLWGGSIFSVPRVSVYDRHRGKRLRARIMHDRPFRYFRRAGLLADKVLRLIVSSLGGSFSPSGGRARIRLQQGD